mmetsp:Transcript_21591/g.55554  ORF Transcript_21591/g.55554 Transcript_21591/m.55554 type:complete len:338 (-) Transcript_21591:117-1130(-)
MLKHAIATVISGSQYLPLLLAWLHSVTDVYKREQNIDFVILHCDVDMRALEAARACALANHTKANITLVHGCLDHPSRNHWFFKEAIQAKNHIALRYLRTFSVYRLWSLYDYERVLFMDVDTIAIRPAIKLVGTHSESRRATWQAAVECVKIEAYDTCNTGVLLIHPNSDLYGRVLTVLKRIEDENILLLSDQSFFTSFFGECVKMLSRNYNYLAMHRSSNWPWRIGLTKAFIFHYRSTLFKPINVHRGNELNYDPRRPNGVFAVYHNHYGPMDACYRAKVAAGTAPDIGGGRAMGKVGNAEQPKNATRETLVAKELENGYRRGRQIADDVRCRLPD